MFTKVKFVEGFKDGTIFPNRSFRPGDEVVLTQAQVEQVQRSGGVIEIRENVIRNPLKDEKLLLREEMGDPQNADNSINDLESHIPGTEDEVVDQREKEVKKEAEKNRKKK